MVTLMKNVNAGHPIDPAILQTNGLPKDLPSPSDQVANDDPTQEHSSELVNSFGRIKLTNDETSYVESAHWTAILDGVRHL